MAINYVRFQRGSQAAYQELVNRGNVDSNTLYFIYDNKGSTGVLYMGDKLISGGDTVFTSATLDDLSDVIVQGAATNSFLVKSADGNWIAKSLTDVIQLIKESLEIVANNAQVYQIQLNENELPENAIIRAIGDNLISSGDIVIIKKSINNNKYEYTAYVYDGINWIAMDGNYSITNIYTHEDIQVTTNVGELKANTIINAGTNVADLLVQILSQSKNPNKINPSISTFNVTNNGFGTNFEAGTTITPKWVSTFDNGSYDYKSTVSKDNIIPIDDTGVVVNNWSITKDGVGIGTVKDGIGENLILGDSTVNFKIIANYSNGNYALTNLNKLPEEDVRITASSVNKTANITSFRKMFAGGTTVENIDSALIRSLSASEIASTSNFEFKAEVGDTKLIFAYPSNLTSKKPKFEYFTMSWEPVGGFTELGIVQVADARGGTNGLKDYTVYTYTPAAAYATETKYRVSF